MMNALWQIQLMGGLVLQRGEQTITRFYTHKTGVLLAYLAFHSPQSHSRDSLIERFWPESDLGGGRNSLSVSLSTLRRQLEPPGVPPGTVLIADRVQVRLHPEAIHCDVTLFEQLAQAAHRCPKPEDRMALLLQAVACYRGDLLPAYYDDWVLSERERLRECYRYLLRRLAHDLAECGDYAHALDHALQAMQIDLLDEGVCLDVLRLYALTGRPEMASRLFQEFETRLQKILGHAPSGEMIAAVRELEKGKRTPFSLNSGSPPLEKEGPSMLLVPPQPPPPPSNLPPRFTRFFGRQEEIALIHQYLTAQDLPAPLLTLTGVGGSGKTRLALEAAQALQEAFTGGVWVVEFADETRPGQIWNLVRDTLGLVGHPQSDVLKHLVSFLAEQDILLVLDNCEHLLPEGADAIQALRDRLPHLRLLATSRQPLELPGEQEFETLPLPIPPPSASPEHLMEFSSIQMFVDRARLRQPDFGLTAGNAALVAELCIQLEGIPLAIELATGWIKTLPLKQLLAGVVRRLDLSANRRTGHPERHRTLRAMLERSYQLLSPIQQAFFRRLGVFRGGWTLEAAQAVCQVSASDCAERLDQLRNRSLVVVEEAQAGGAPRYRLLEILREFAEEHLLGEERAEVQGRHAAFYVFLAESAEGRLHGPEEGAWLDLLRVERENLNKILEASQREELPKETGLNLAGSLFWFWHLRGYVGEGIAWLETFLQGTEGQGDTPARAKAMRGAGQLSFYSNTYAKAWDYLEGAAAIYRKLGDDWGYAASYNYLGNLYWLAGKQDEARSLWREMLAIMERLGDPWGQAIFRWQQGWGALLSHDLPTAQAELEACAALYRAIGDQWGLVAPFFYGSWIARQQGDLPRAQELMQKALECSEDTGDRIRQAGAYGELATLALEAGDTTAAQQHRETAESLSHGVGNPEVTQVLLRFIQFALKQGNLRIAACLCGCLEAATETPGNRLSPSHQSEFEQAQQSLQARLDEETLHRQWQHGRTLTPGQAAQASWLNPALLS